MRGSLPGIWPKAGSSVGNASLVDDKTVLIILLRPRIIDLKEEQGITYPALGER